MFTSRSEYRLSHRQDNADMRLTRKALSFGEKYGSNSLPRKGHIVTDDERVSMCEFRELEISRALGVLHSTMLPRAVWNGYGGAFVMKFGALLCINVVFVLA